MKGEPIFGDSEWINAVKKNERRDKLVEQMMAVLEEFGDMEPFEIGGVIHTAASVFYEDADVLDIHEFVRGAKGGRLK